MKTRWIQFARALSVVAVAAALPACVTDNEPEGTAEETETPAADEGEQIQLGTAEQGVMTCSNLDGTNSAMAALAVATAQELGRWQAGKDFVQGNIAGEILALGSGSDASGPIGKSRCGDGKCAKVQALLDMQLDANAGKIYFQGSGNTKVLLNPQALRSRMLSKWREQKDFDARAKDNDPKQAPKEEHKLTFVSAAKGSCDTNFTFQATKTTGAALLYPAQLKWKVAFADINNPYIDFKNLGGGKLSVDPTWGLNEDGTSTGGTCSAICTKITTTSVLGQCCSCGGLTKTFIRSATNPVTYLCQ